MTRKYPLWVIILTLAVISAWSVIWFHFILSDERHLLKFNINKWNIIKRDFPYNCRNKQTINQTTNQDLSWKDKHSTIRDNTSPTSWEISKNGRTEPAKLAYNYADSFKKDWCRIHEARLDWQTYLGPCANDTKFGTTRQGVENRTDASRSVISHWNIRPAGQFSKFFIQTKTSLKHAKHIGGDAWRVHVSGAASVSPTVFDHRDGTYEIVFLAMEPGLYAVHIFLDYTLCDGLKDPPIDWYKQGNIQGKNQPEGTLKEPSPYLMQPFGNGKPIIINILKPEYPANIQSHLDDVRRKLFVQKRGHDDVCSQQCRSAVWDGLGRWVSDSWRPFVEDADITSSHSAHKGVFWIYGDSVAKMFKEALAIGNFYEVCEKIFRQCRLTYTWIYNMDGYLKEPGKEPVPDGIDYDHEKVMSELKQVLYHKDMDEHSVLLLNWGIHFAAAVNFSDYQRLINDFVKTVQLGKQNGQFKGKIVWKTTTAIYRQRYPNPHKDVRRFLTFPRIVLYNAYAMSVMCQAGIDVIDVYPISDAFPGGTISRTDPVHYEMRAFGNVEALLHTMFKSNKKSSPRQVDGNKRLRRNA